MNIQIFVGDPYQQILNNNVISLIKSNPILKSNIVKYIGKDYIIQKVVRKIQPHWSGKRIVTMQVISSNKQQQVVEQKIQRPVIINQGRKKNGKDIDSKTVRQS